MFGKNTLIIMGIHIIVLQIITKIINVIMDILNMNINVYLQGGIIFAFTAIISLLCSIFIKKFIPKIILINNKN